MQKHLFHLVDPSPWPLLTAMSALGLVFGFVMYMHRYSGGLFLFFFGLLSVVYCMGIWWRDVIREASYEGYHTGMVQLGLRYGMAFFILSEVMFFVAFFWAFFYSGFVPVPQVGCIWPPLGVFPFNPIEVPLLNTLILLSSGVSITYAHHALINGDRAGVLVGLGITIYLAVWFTALQLLEYSLATFFISDSVFGSGFFMATGFHGFHVIVGTVFITVCFLRVFFYQFTSEHHFGFEASAWYWHFVDVVWIFLYLTVYGWSYL